MFAFALLLQGAVLAGADRMRTLIRPRALAAQPSLLGCGLADPRRRDRGPRRLSARSARPQAASTGNWTFDLWITGPLFGSGLVYPVGLAVLWSRAGVGHGVPRWQAAAFAAGWLALAAALVSPLHHAGAQLFTAHMIEHELVMAVAAPLLVLARPGGGLPVGLPAPAPPSHRRGHHDERRPRRPGGRSPARSPRRSCTAQRSGYGTPRRCSTMPC